MLIDSQIDQSGHMKASLGQWAGQLVNRKVPFDAGQSGRLPGAPAAPHLLG